MKRYEDYPLIGSLTDSDVFLIKSGGHTYRATIAVFTAKLLAAVAGLGQIVVRNDLISLTGLTNSLASVSTTGLAAGTTYLLSINDNGALWKLRFAVATGQDVAATDNAGKSWRRIMGL